MKKVFLFLLFVFLSKKEDLVEEISKPFSSISELQPNSSKIKPEATTVCQRKLSHNDSLVSKDDKDTIICLEKLSDLSKEDLSDVSSDKNPCTLDEQKELKSDTGIDCLVNQPVKEAILSEKSDSAINIKKESSEIIKTKPSKNENSEQLLSEYVVYLDHQDTKFLFKETLKKFELNPKNELCHEFLPKVNTDKKLLKTSSFCFKTSCKPSIEFSFKKDRIKTYHKPIMVKYHEEEKNNKTFINVDGNKSEQLELESPALVSEDDNSLISKESESNDQNSGYVSNKVKEFDDMSECSKYSLDKSECSVVKITNGILKPEPSTISREENESKETTQTADNKPENCVDKTDINKKHRFKTEIVIENEPSNTDSQLSTIQKQDILKEINTKCELIDKEESKTGCNYSDLKPEKEDDKSFQSECNCLNASLLKSSHDSSHVESENSISKITTKIVEEKDDKQISSVLIKDSQLQDTPISDKKEETLANIDNPIPSTSKTLQEHNLVEKQTPIKFKNSTLRHSKSLSKKSVKQTPSEDISKNKKKPKRKGKFYLWLSNIFKKKNKKSKLSVNKEN